MLLHLLEPLHFYQLLGGSHSPITGIVDGAEVIVLELAYALVDAVLL